MKKLSLILATLMMLTVLVSSFSINFSAKGPMDDFTEVAPVAEENQINSTTWNHLVGMNIDVEPNGTWSWATHFDGKDSCWGMNQAGTFLDSDYKTVIIEYKDVDYTDKNAEGVSQIVFTDLYTQSGLGDYGRVRAKAETFEKMSVCYSEDGENWTEVKFTVGYHTNANTYTGYQGATYAVDTYWHLIFEETAPTAKFFAIMTDESADWDADDHTPGLGAIMDWKYIYLVKSNLEEGSEITLAPETDPVTTEAPATNAPETNAPAADDAADMTWLYIVIAAAVVVAVVVILVVVKKKK